LDRHKGAATGFSYGATGQRPVSERIRRWFSALGAETREIIRLARQEKLTLLLAWLLVFMLIGSIVFYFNEAGRNSNVNSYFDALYWSIVSITTVGYGDLAPTTAVARTVSVLMLLSFMALMPVVGATITSIYVSKKIKEERGLDTITFGQHIVICGWNNNGHNVLAGLQEQEPQTPVVIVGELDQDHFENIAGGFPQLNLHFVRGKYTNEATLRRANVRQAKVALVLISYSMDSLMRSDETAVLTVLTLRELGPNLRIVAECFASSYRGHLRHAGANRVIVSGELDSFMITAAAISPGLDTSLKDAMTFGAGSDLWTVPIPPEYVGKTFKELALDWLTEKNWLLIGLIQERRKLGITDVLSGESSSIDDFITRQFQAAGRGAGTSQHMHYLNPGPEHEIRDQDRAIVIYPVED